MGKPGWPELAFSTASIDRNRIELTDFSTNADPVSTRVLQQWPGLRSVRSRAYGGCGGARPKVFQRLSWGCRIDGLTEELSSFAELWSERGEIGRQWVMMKQPWLERERKRKWLFLLCWLVGESEGFLMLQWARAQGGFMYVNMWVTANLSRGVWLGNNRLSYWVFWSFNPFPYPSKNYLSTCITFL